MKPIYSNFDGLDITFQGAVPEHILEALAEAKREAQDTKNDAIAKIGKNERVVLVAETGSRGGFTYRLDTGFHGETWFIVHTNKRDGWNIRVSIKSLTLALYGYEGVKQKVLDFLLIDLEAIGSPRRNAIGELIETPLERISRIDFCIDYRTDEFVPIAEAFIGKGRFKKRILNTQDFESNTTSEIIYSGRFAKYFRMGSMPYRQVVLYDKISDITEKKKNYWWRIWGINKSEFKGQIWRIEARAGKKELNNWNLRRFKDFEVKAGDVISSILKDIKYTIPSLTDKNVTRWPLAPFWKEAISIARHQLQNHISNSERKIIIEGHRKEISNQFEKSILGQTVSYAALNGMDVSEIPAVLDVLGDNLLERVRKNPAKFSKNHEKAKEKYSQLSY